MATKRVFLTTLEQVQDLISIGVLVYLLWYYGYISELTKQKERTSTWWDYHLGVGNKFFIEVEEDDGDATDE